MPITANTDYFLTDSGEVKFRSSLTKIYCTWATGKDDITAVNIEVWDTAGELFFHSDTVRFTESELEAFTGSGTGEFTQFKSVVELAIKDYLDGRTGNTGVVTFTIA